MNTYFLLALVWGSFFALHSAFASPPAKRWLGAHRVYRLAYNVCSFVLLLFALGYTALIPPVWLLPRNAVTQFVGLALATYGILVLRAAAKQYDWGHFFGTKQLRDGASEHEETLRTEGILQRVRHPLYLALILLLTGYFFFAPSWSNLVVWACTMAYLPVGIFLEERKLVGRFGEAYRRYQREVPMLFPRRFGFGK